MNHTLSTLTSAFNKALDTEQSLRDFIGDIVRTRSRMLHISTSSTVPIERKHARIEAMAMDDMLIDALSQLPDHRPEFQVWVVNPITEEVYYLQSVDGDKAHYVPFAQWKPDEIAYNPIDRVERLQSERSRSQEALETIRTMELLDLDPIVALEDDVETAKAKLAKEGVAKG